MFNENSAIVHSWVRIINSPNSAFIRDSIPDINNLREVVISILDRYVAPIHAT